MQSFTSEKITTNFTDDLPKYWNDNSPVKTHFFNSISLMFPGGEGFFIDSLNAVKDKITDEKLKRECTEFIAQESRHKSVHKQYNKWLEIHGYPVNRLENEMNEKFKKIKKQFHPNFWMALTSAQEHITVCMAEWFLRNPEITVKMHPEFKKIWTWHAIEEVEHRAVAIETSNHLNIKAYFRLITFLLSIMFFVKLIRYMCILLNHDKQLFKLKTIKDGIHFTLNFKNGLFIKSFKYWLRLFYKNYNPINYNTDLLQSIVKPAN